MISNRELRTLKWQLLLTGGLFLGCIVLAILIAANRNYLETFVKEKYKTSYDNMPRAAQDMIDQAANGQVAEETQKKLSRQHLRYAYEDWMMRSEPARPRTPAALVSLNAAFFLEAAERTMVCGSREQRRRSLDFFRLAGSSDAEPRLRRLQRWAARRNLGELAEQISSVIQQQTPTATDDET